MYPVSDAFEATLKQSHTMVTRAEIWEGSSMLQEFNINDGTVTVQDEAIRRRVTCTLTDPDGSLTPATASDLLAPVGNELRLYRGVVIPSTGVEEVVPLGVFGISDTRIYDSGGGLTLSIDAYDRARKVSRSKFTTEYVIAAGTNVATAIQAMINARVPGLTYNFTPTTAVTPVLVYNTGDDPWAKARELAASIGYDLYFDQTGICCLTPVPVLTQSTPTVWDYEEGPEATFLYLNRRLTDERTYSHVVITGEGNGIGEPVRAEAYDNNPASPTYYLGAYGDIVLFESNRIITTFSQAQTVANARLQRVSGLVDLVEMQAIVNAAHDVYDVIGISRARLNIDARYVISKLSIPMTQDRAMNVSVKQGTIPSA